MKSLDKFQYDSSPHTNGEVESFGEESIVGMARNAGKAIGNVLRNTQQGNNQTKLPTPTPLAQKRAKLNNIVNNQSKKVERVQQRVDNKVKTAANNFTKQTNELQKNLATRKDAVQAKDAKIQQNVRALKSDSNRVRKAAEKKTRNDPSLGEPRLINRIKNLGYKDNEKRKDLLRGGLSSKLARNVGSVAKAVGQGITKPPTTKVSYNQKGDGYSGAFGGLGDNVKQVGSNVLKAPSFSSSSKDKDTGKITKGDQSGTVGDKVSERLTGARSKDTKSSADKVEVTGGTKVTGLDSKAKRRRKQNLVTQSSKKTNNNARKQEQNKLSGKGITNQMKTNRQQGADLLANIKGNPKARNTQLLDMDDDELKKRTGSSDDNRFARNANREAEDRDAQGNIINRYGKKQAYIKRYDNFPRGKDATHWLDAEKQHSSETPKLFEQFLFEIDTKSTKKKKKDGRGMHPHDEIKPMSGTNVITINPEDETSKYKRGY